MASLTTPLAVDPGRSQPPDPIGRLSTTPNLITILRTALAVGIATYALAEHNGTGLMVGYAVYWIGDVADGWTARRLRQETRLGAVLDIVGDRACTALLGATALTFAPHLWFLAALFFVSFMVIDTMLSLAFLAWPLLSPNDFHRVDRLVWRLNWWPPAKCLNTAAVVLLVIAGFPTVAYAVCIVVLASKVWSCRRVVEALGDRWP
ncbi:CDP-alcohol phosphatidyltransferase family protein [Demetria terragena]|uniref:CDP-alcohol phosphatidyltransferase family protein n=1 Tax=Demetria terragena TaxID=63959 RepID=UPI00037FE912|nr:CDP-alcohol phosphatidyltransferase family protein [Demetria terragena]